MRVRIRFSKLGKVRWTSHRDVARIWERALRKAALPVAYSEGFSPHPRLAFGLALSTGHESVAEYLDVDLLELPGDLEALPARLAACLPVGMEVLAARPLARGAPSLQQVVTSSSWRINLGPLDAGAVAAAVQAALEAPTLELGRVRKGERSVDDIRPAIVSLRCETAPAAADPAAPDVVVLADLATQPRSLRPSELVAAVTPWAEERRVLRTHQWIDRDGARTEPIELPDDAAAPHTWQVCA